MRKTTKTTTRKPVGKKTATKASQPKVANSMFSGMKLFPSRSAKKENPRRPTAKRRNGEIHPAFGFTSLEIIRNRPRHHL